MKKCYQYDASGIFVGEIMDYGLLPNNATYKAPELKHGFIPHWTGKKWEQVENHIGKKGFINGVAVSIEEYGALPDGFSEIPPEPVLEEVKAEALRQLKDLRLKKEYAGAFVEVDGKKIRFPMDLKDEIRINSLTTLFAADPTTKIENWKVSDGSYVTMTAELLQKVKAAGFLYINKVFAIERKKRAEIKALQNADAVKEWLKSSLHLDWEDRS